MVWQLCELLYTCYLLLTYAEQGLRNGRTSVRPSDCYLGADDVIQLVVLAAVAAIGNESAPIQLAQCRFPGLAISNAKISIFFSNEIYGSNFIKQHSSETIMV